MRNYTTRHVMKELRIGSITLQDLKENHGLEYDRVGNSHFHDLDEVRAARQRRDDAFVRKPLEKDNRVPDGNRCVRSDKIRQMFGVSSTDLWRLQMNHGLKNARVSKNSRAFYDPDEVREAIQKRDAPVLKPNWATGTGQEPVDINVEIDAEREAARLRPRVDPKKVKSFTLEMGLRSGSNAVAIAKRRGES